MSKEDAERESVNLLKMVGIPRPEVRLRDYPHQFSGGMRQRVMIAIAISCKPKLIIADEPTTAVDVTIQAQLLELIRKISRENDTSLILITHNLGIVARYAHRVFVMYAGRIVEYGNSIDVYHHPEHPYTAGLLGSVPRLDEPRKTRLTPIADQPPDLISLPAGCAFKTRCLYDAPQCETDKPVLVEVSRNHFSTCRLARNGQRPWQTKSS